MVNKNFFWVMLVIVLAFGVTVVGCASNNKNSSSTSNSDPISLSGTSWKNQSVNGTMIISFDDSGAFTVNGTVGSRSMSTSGTYSLSGNQVTFKPNTGISYKGTISGVTLTTQGSKYTKQ